MSIRIAITRTRTALLTLALAVPLIFVAQTTTGAGRAEAGCPNVNSPQTGYLIVSAFLGASETPASYTCNNDGSYEGTLQSNHEDWRASLVFWNPATGMHYGFFGNYGYDPYFLHVSICCGFTRIVLCLDRFEKGGGAYCGWGSNWTYHPTDFVLSYAKSGDNTYY